MKQYSIFDIIGPDMIGPSSSHTAGAAKISYMASKIFGLAIQSVLFELHGSLNRMLKNMYRQFLQPLRRQFYSILKRLPQFCLA